MLEALWPEEEDIDVAHAFDSAVSVLRKVLCTQHGESLLAKSRAGGVTIFSLPGQERLWVDADAFLGSVEQATHAERMGADPLPILEAAHALVTGEFLEDELYSGWAEPRRQMINAAHHRCLYRLADLYYSEKNFNAALPLYRRASVRIKDPKLVNSAKFFSGRCLEGLGQKSEARAVYEELHRLELGQVLQRGQLLHIG